MRVLTCVCALLLAACVRESEKDRAMIGRSVTFRGAVTEHGIGPASESPYFRIAMDGVSVKCYYQRGGSPAIGQYATVAGTVSMWYGETGNLRPCAIIAVE